MVNGWRIYCCWIVKLDNLGNLLWQKSLGGSEWDTAESIQQTTDGGFIVAGYSRSMDGDVAVNNCLQDYWIVKLDNLGIILWQKSLGGSASDNAMSMQQTLDGGFIAAGYTRSDNGDVAGNHGMNDMWVVKFSSAINTTVVQNAAVVCNGESNGIASVSATGGVPPYSYHWDSDKTVLPQTI